MTREEKLAEIRSLNLQMGLPEDNGIPLTRQQKLDEISRLDQLLASTPESFEEFKVRRQKEKERPISEDLSAFAQGFGEGVSEVAGQAVEAGKAVIEKKPWYWPLAGGVLFDYEMLGDIINVGSRDFTRFAKTLTEAAIDKTYSEEIEVDREYRRYLQNFDYNTKVRPAMLETVEDKAITDFGANFVDPFVATPVAAGVLPSRVAAWTARGMIKSTAKAGSLAATGVAKVGETTAKLAGLPRKAVAAAAAKVVPKEMRDYAGASAFGGQLVGAMTGAVPGAATLGISEAAGYVAGRVGRNVADVLKVFSDKASNARFLYRLATDPNVARPWRKMAMWSYKKGGTQIGDAAFNSLVNGVTAGALNAALAAGAGEGAEGLGQAAGAGYLFGAAMPFGQPGVKGGKTQVARDTQSIEKHMQNKVVADQRESFKKMDRNAQIMFATLSEGNVGAPKVVFQPKEVYRQGGGSDTQAYFSPTDRTIYVNEGRLKKGSQEAMELMAHEVGHDFVKQALGNDPAMLQILLEEYKTTPEKGEAFYWQYDQEGNPIGDPIHLDERASAIRTDYDRRMRGGEGDTILASRDEVQRKIRELEDYSIFDVSAAEVRARNKEIDRLMDLEGKLFGDYLGLSGKPKRGIGNDASTLAQEIGADQFSMMFSENPNVFESHHPRLRRHLIDAARKFLTSTAQAEPLTGNPLSNTISKHLQRNPAIERLFRNYIQARSFEIIEKGDIAEAGVLIEPRKGQTGEERFTELFGGVGLSLAEGKNLRITDKRLFEELKAIRDRYENEAPEGWKVTKQGWLTGKKLTDELRTLFTRNERDRFGNVANIIDAATEAIAQRIGVRFGYRSGTKGKYQNPFKLRDVGLYGFLINPIRFSGGKDAKRQTRPTLKVVGYDEAKLRHNVEVMVREGIVKDPKEFFERLAKQGQEALLDPEGRINPDGRKENEDLTVAFGMKGSLENIASPRLKELLEKKKIKDTFVSYDLEAMAGLSKGRDAAFVFDYENVRDNYSHFFHSANKMPLPKPQKPEGDKLFMPWRDEPYYRGDIPQDEYMEGGAIRKGVQSSDLKYRDVPEINEQRPAIYLTPDEETAYYFATSIGYENAPRKYKVNTEKTATREDLNRVTLEAFKTPHTIADVKKLGWKVEKVSVDDLNTVGNDLFIREYAKRKGVKSWWEPVDPDGNKLRTLHRVSKSWARDDNFPSKKEAWDLAIAAAEESSARKAGYNPRMHSISYLSAEEVAALKKAGYDSIEGEMDFKGEGGGRELAVFSEKQLKPAPTPEGDKMFMPAEEGLRGVLGSIEKDGVFRQFEEGNLGKMMHGAGRSEGNFRYNADTKIVFWWYEPTQKLKKIVEGKLKEKGYEVKGHDHTLSEIRYVTDRRVRKGHPGWKRSHGPRWWERNKLFMPADRPLGLRDNIREDVLPSIKQDKLSPGQFKAALGKTAGAKAYAEEIGLLDFLDGKKSVTKDEIDSYVAENAPRLEEKRLGDFLHSRPHLIDRLPDGDPKFSEYQEPGGTNYREVLIKLPEAGLRKIDTTGWTAEKTSSGVRPSGEPYARVRWNVYDKEGVLIDNEKLAESSVDAIRDAANLLAKEERTPYRDPHFQEDNVLLHLRLNDRIDADGKKVLFIEELQSDWHQKGRKDGYGRGRQTLEEIKRQHSDHIELLSENDIFVDVAPDSPNLIGFFTEGEILTNPRDVSRDYFGSAVPEIRDAMTDIINARADDPVGVPDAPFKKNWPALGLKRAIKEAIENGYDRVAWLDGEGQAARYDLSRHVDAVEVIPEPGGTYEIMARLIDEMGGEFRTLATKVPKEKLADHIGKEPAQKALEKIELEKKRGGEMPFARLEGLDLKVGGEGMKAFYDRELVSIANKISKKIGGGKVRRKRIGSEETPKSGWVIYDVANDVQYGPVYDRHGEADTARWEGTAVREFKPSPEAFGSHVLDLPKNPQAVENLRLYMPAEKAPSDSTPPELIFKKDPKGQTTLPFAKTPREETEFARLWNEEAEKTGAPKVGTGEIPDPPKGWQAGTPRETRGAYDPRSPGRMFMPAAEAGATKGKQAEAAKLWQEKGTDSPYFRKWFGKSKVVDENGAPLVLYRGQTSWNKDGTTDYSQERGAPSFTSVPEVANMYAHTRPGGGPMGLSGPKPKGAVAPVFVKMEKPFKVETEGHTSDTRGSVMEILNESNFSWNLYGSAAESKDKTQFTLRDTIDLFDNLADPAEPILVEVKRGWGVEDVADDAYEIGQHLEGKLEDHLDKLESLKKDSDEYWKAEDDFTEDIQHFLDAVMVDTYAVADTHVVRNYAERNGYDGIIHEDVAEGLNPYMIEETVGGKPTEDVKGIKTVDEDGDPLHPEDYSFTAYKPFNHNQVKSAIGNRGTFDVGERNMLYMPAAPEDASPNTVSSWGDGDSPSFPAGYRRGQAPSNEEVAKLFQEKYVERYGEPIDPYDYGPETLDWLADMVASEGEAALQRTGSAVDWYTTAVERAMSIAEEIFPEIKTSKQAKDRFLGALAITSQNMRVLDNAKAAVYQYEYKAKHGKFDYEIDHGGKAPAITKNLRAFDKMESGMTDFHGFLDTDFTVRELTQFGKKFFGDEKFAIDGRMDDVVKGSAVFGPKIGQGFFQNLKGNYDPVTIDLWLRRTFGRLTGRSVDVSLSPQAIGRLIYSHRKNTGRRKTDFELPEFLRGLKISGSIAKDGKMNFKIPDRTFERLFGEHEKGAANADAVFKLAGRLSKEWERRFAAAGRSVTKAKADLQARKKAGRPTKQASARLSKAEAEKAKIQAEKPYWAYAATSISGKLKPIDIPTPQERTVIVQAFHKALAKLREKGYDLTPADLQATLWYPEKDIWSFLKGDKADALNMSYDQAMEKIRDAR